jgi:hypothetical protein
MMKSACAVGAIVALAGIASAQPGLLAVGGFGPTGTQGLYRVDASTGAATLVGDTGVSRFVGIEWDGATRTLYGYTTSGALYAIDQYSATSTLIASVPTFVPEGGLAFDGSALFATDTSFVANIDTSTAALFPAAPLGGAFDFSGIAIDAAGAMFGVATSGAGDMLYSIDYGGFGGATLIGATGTASVSGVAGLDFADDGTLFYTDGSSLFTLDTATGAGTLVGATGFGGFSGLVFVPAPGVVSVVLAGGLFAARRRR